jgi:uncharacterized protein YutE (UPF0331/DUF86 family)
MNVDRERIAKLISSIREAVALLQELQALSSDEFIGDKHKQSSAKYNFIAAIEAAIDLASHLISKRQLRAPEDYADTFQVLAEAGILTDAFGGELKKMARFRNRLVHRYWDVDAGELWQILQSRLGDFEKYIAQIGAILAQEVAENTGTGENLSTRHM